MCVGLKHVTMEIIGKGLLSNGLFLDLERAPLPNKRSRVLRQHLRAAIYVYRVVVYPSCANANKKLLIAGIVLDFLVSTGV